MKLRAKIIDREMIIYLMKVLASMAKMAKNLVFKFTETHVTILADAKHIVDGQLTIWAQLTVNQYFQEYKFNGVCTENNWIVFEVEADKLQKLVHSFQGDSNQLVIKLKRSSTGPTVRFTLYYPSNQKDRDIINDMGIRIIHRSEWDHFAEPDVAHFDVS